MKGALKGAALGALVASAASLLLARKSGKKTRADLSKFLHSTSVNVQKRAKKMTNLSQDQYGELFLDSLASAAKKKEEVAELLSDVSTILKKGWDDVRRELNEASGKPTKKTKGKK